MKPSPATILQQVPTATSRAVLALMALLAAPGMLFAQGQPVGPEFRVNTYTANNQIYSSVASDLPGRFVVVWTSCWTQDGFGCGVYAQRYSLIVPVELQSFRVE